jgi:hypothetical protein
VFSRTLNLKLYRASTIRRLLGDDDDDDDDHDDHGNHDDEEDQGKHDHGGCVMGQDSVGSPGSDGASPYLSRAAMACGGLFLIGVVRLKQQYWSSLHLCRWFRTCANRAQFTGCEYHVNNFTDLLLAIAGVMRPFS